MLIRSEQVSGIQRSRFDEYVEALARHLETNFAGQIAARNLAGANLRNVVRGAIHDAHEYAVYTPADVKFYIECVALLGAKFDTDASHPWAGDILRRDDLTGTSKMDAINESLLFGPGGPR
jgi:hypothetical protein